MRNSILPSSPQFRAHPTHTPNRPSHVGAWTALLAGVFVSCLGVATGNAHAEDKTQAKKGPAASDTAASLKKLYDSIHYKNYRASF